MTRIAILTPTLISADAVSNDVLAMQRVLSARGHEIALFADNSNVTNQEVRKAGAAKSFLRTRDDVLIYHHSIGWERGLEVLRGSSCRKVIKYHNVTPPEFFEGISAEHESLCRRGRDQLKDIVAANPDLYLSASAFNAQDFLQAGSDERKTFVVAPFNHVDKLQAGEADLELLDQYNDGAINLITVGGVRPNKGHAALIEAFATYYYHFNGRARLFIVGAENHAFNGYMRMLRGLIDSWALDSRVVFTGQVSDQSLKAYYLLAHALLMTSEHEGFCVPLVEAMALKVPIVAYASTAIPETAAGAALVWEERDPFLMAQSIDWLLTSDDTRMALTSRGYDRYEATFSNHLIERQFLDTLARAGLQI
jgi:glycosyltransferase involved in cell wall biosynthesis